MKLIKNKASNIKIPFLFGLYVFVHLFVAFHPVRSWPFTDYPMFSNVLYENSNIEVYKYFGQDRQGNETPLSRSFFSGYSLGEPNLTDLYLKGHIDEFKYQLTKWLTQNDKYFSIKFYKISLKKPTWKDRSVQTYKELLLEINSKNKSP